MFVLRLICSSVLLTVVAGETVLLASCPKEPEVTGKYYHKGERCVRDKVILDRKSVNVRCPDESYKYRVGYCSRRGNEKVQPICPEGYERYGSKCHSTCPPGYKKDINICILPKDSLPSLYMTCPEGYQKEGRYCKAADDLIECKINAPGTFYYKDGLCERQGHAIPRDFTPKPKGTRKCPEGKVLTRGVYCQDPCPEGYQKGKGKCELRQCAFAADASMVLCPEGGYQIPSSIL